MSILIRNLICREIYQCGALGPSHLPIRLVLGALTPGVKTSWRETDPSRPSSVEVKNAWSYTYTSQIRSLRGT